MKIHVPKIILLVPMLVLALTAAKTQASENPDTASVQVSSRMLLNYLCDADTIELKATLSINRGDHSYGLMNAGILFNAAGDKDTQTLGTFQTDQEGNAVCRFPVNKLVAGKEGVITYSARFPGNDKYPEAEAEFSAKPIRIRLFFSIEDSLRIMKVTATQKDSKGLDVPVAKENVLVYVPRLFSLLKIGEFELDENGTGTMEFPKEIVGDTLGNLAVIARIEEHDVYGNAEGQNVINWGVHKQYYKAEVPSRELWTPIAPLWMIITLIIMLLGVWAHYAYAVYELLMIKRLSKKEKQLY